MYNNILKLYLIKHDFYVTNTCRNKVFSREVSGDKGRGTVLQKLKEEGQFCRS